MFVFFVVVTGFRHNVIDHAYTEHVQIRQRNTGLYTAKQEQASGHRPVRLLVAFFFGVDSVFCDSAHISTICGSAV